MSRVVTDERFEGEVLKSPGLSVVDFWAEWCGPCRALSPTIEALAEEHKGAIQVFKMDVDANPITPSQYGVRGIPTVLFIKDGQVVDRLVGNHPKETLQQTIRKHKGE